MNNAKSIFLIHSLMMVPGKFFSVFKFSSIIFFLITASHCICNAQSVEIYPPQQFGLEPIFKYGKIWKHTAHFEPAIEHNSFSGELNLMWLRMSNRYRSTMKQLPYAGLAVGYCSFGNEKVLGNEFYIIPNMQLKIFGNEEISFWFKGGVGLAYLTKHYDALTNPTNNVIASSVNNASTVAFHFRMQANKSLLIVAGASFTHSSTGDVRLPNLGINIPTVDIGVEYFFRNQKSIPAFLTFPEKKIFPVFTLRTGVGFNEIYIPDGPVYPEAVNDFSLGMNAKKHPHKFSFGLESVYNMANYFFLSEQEIGDHRKLNSISLAPYIEDEIQFGVISFSFTALYQIRTITLSGYPFYQKLGLQHYIFQSGKNESRKLSAGIFLTTHLVNADYVSAMLSLQL
ncbi:MAG TPA: hypothetical protein DCQ93_08490 [Bacteroidetes bacterium]|nr:hypothetical protein [Bacteroidota bacterium]